MVSVKVIYTPKTGLYNTTAESDSDSEAELDFSAGHIGVQYVKVSVKEISSSYVVQNESLLLCDATNNLINVYLPSASPYEGRELSVKKTDISSNAVNLIPESNQKIDGENSSSIVGQWTTLKLVAHNSNWYVV